MSALARTIALPALLAHVLTHDVDARCVRAPALPSFNRSSDARAVAAGSGLQVSASAEPLFRECAIARHRISSISRKLIMSKFSLLNRATIAVVLVALSATAFAGGGGGSRGPGPYPYASTGTTTATLRDGFKKAPWGC